ncbi:SDR family NAD(P)-dependent oxidoreductase [Sphingomonas sp. 2R-10]|uniref:SDR family NAD(P)-dependent oxidoreductase n=1 Tax=Sphingomonas sp. 2R-10 TaxID=3045148 RepID=UPI000F7B59EB|nr:SDR family NAD(P)-dependent oxidoreductase [Sphingomonas sp. 2R-10]MDJ0275719.1 SDR family NAD(P)-dependent oxidoreductase [Sphingomonas sp. 2R-10]
MARVFITGSTDGLSLAAARSLLADGHDVVLHARSGQRAGELGAIRERASGVVIGDLASAHDVRRIADQVNAIGRMDAVIHNAGLYSVPERGSTPEGHATLLAVNTLAPYILTALIERPDRLVYLSSGLHRGGEGSLDDLDWTTRPWDTARAYAESKLHLLALALAIAQDWPDVRSNAVDPGWVQTRMGGASAPVDLDTGARTQSWLAGSDDPAALTSGGYWHHQRRQEPAAEATDVRFQDALLARLAALTGVRLTQTAPVGSTGGGAGPE